MAAEHGNYVCLTQGWLKSSRMTTLWLGEDHLLQETRLGTSHLYHRFYFRDMHGLIVRRTGTGAAFSAILIVVLALLVILMVSIGEAIPVWLGLICPLAALLIWNIARGPTCTSYVQTAVHVRHLPSLGRVKMAVAALQILRPRVTEAQGGGSPEDIRTAAITAAPTLMPSAPGGEPPLPPPAPAGR